MTARLIGKSLETREVGCKLREGEDRDQKWPSERPGGSNVNDAAIRQAILSAYSPQEEGGCGILKQAIEIPRSLEARSILDAYQLQEACVQQLCSMWQVQEVGFKIAMTNPDDQNRIQADGPAFGRLNERQLLDSASTLNLAAHNQPLVEPELLMRTTQEIAQGATLEAVSGCVEIAAGLEIPVSRFNGWWPEGGDLQLSVPALIADNTVTGYVVLGETWQEVKDLPLNDIDVRVACDNEILAEGNTRRVLGNPLNSVVWLANKLAEFDASIPPQSIISTGATTVPIQARTGTYRADFDRVGSVELTFL